MKIKFQVMIMEKHLKIMDIVLMDPAIMEKCLAPHIHLFMRDQDQDQGLPKSPTMSNLWED